MSRCGVFVVAPWKLLAFISLIIKFLAGSYDLFSWSLTTFWNRASFELNSFDITAVIDSIRNIRGISICQARLTDAQPSASLLVSVQYLIVVNCRVSQRHHRGER